MNIGIIAKNSTIMKTASPHILNIARKYSCQTFFLFENYNDGSNNVLLKKDFYKNIDILVSLGGDGTILQYGKDASKNNVSIFGINFGRVGFLSDIEKSELELFEQVLLKNYTIEERMMIDAEFIDKGSVVRKCTALNDIVISRGISPKMLEMEIYIDDELTDTIRSDGVIFATPTGSTAYSLSAGGCVIDPKSRLIEITPICSHTLSSRPLIIGEKRKITLKHICMNENEVSYISTDGDMISEFSRSCIVNITVSDEKISLIRVKNRNFYSVLKEKL